MFSLVLNMQKTKKYIIEGTIFFILFLAIFFTLDYLNMSYQDMNLTYGSWLVVLNIFMNIVMALLSTLMMNFSTALVELRASKGNGSNLGFLATVFGIFTYGCTSCVIAFMSAVGINLVVIALPFAGLPYKFLSLLLIIIGLGIIMREIKVGVCKIK
ncbi:Uncharacterised protein [Acholeplasma oculi]|uniref:Uncharacterized protein n=1 Tax=Acholeplasma oculi TaxID=35623 RepID=A0A061AJC1_9MOLU|nr:hypothetical protein [Acholeplasma oculi]CDR31087.1 hypothetical protein Aocu_10140 [Acholeplasma oculi]SKC36915.1 hypothetical protein SAMN02745122_0445 [Acholeplasma oculi]SUT90739.1 Uncharacterised protein [Acholeplasma oculi]